MNFILIMLTTFAYYADIKLNAFATLLCSKLSWHNRLKPTDYASQSVACNGHPSACGHLHDSPQKLASEIADKLTFGSGIVAIS